MKNFFIVLFITFLSMINLTISKSNLKKFTNKIDAFSTFTASAYLKSKAIAAHQDTIWVCTTSNKLYKYGGFSKGIQGTKPTSCEKIATNNDGELYVIDSSKNLHYLKKINSSNYNWKKTEKNIVDVTVGINGEVYILDTTGYVYEFKGDKKGSKFTTQKYASAKSIATTFENERVMYIVDSSGNVYRQTASSRTKLYPNIVADKVCVNQSSFLFISTGLGIYMRNPRVNDLTLFADGIAKDMGCGNKLWVVAEDGYIYENSSSWVKVNNN